MVHNPQDGSLHLIRGEVPESDTIAAVATPPGVGGVGIVRVSGAAAGRVREAVLGRDLRPRHAEYLPFLDSDGTAIDRGIALFFPGPHSFTGEDVLELQGHGGAMVMDRLLQRVLGLGIRMARPGEFSERAFLNGKLDLVQAEAVADLISSTTVDAARSAMRSLQGEFSREVNHLVERVVELRIRIEAALDFPDEEIEFLNHNQAREAVADLQNRVRQLLDSSRQGSLLRDGMRIVIAGRPNAGKSTLLNALARRERAIVAPIPGTTRDILREQIEIDGMPLHVSDTAGLRDGGDVVEQEGIRRAWAEIEKADRVLWIVDDRMAEEEQGGLFARLPRDVPLTLIRNKIDITGGEPGLIQRAAATEIALSARTGAGMELLREHLKSCIGFQSCEGLFMARRRHLDALRRADEALTDARSQLEYPVVELAAEELRQVQRALGEITGEFCNEDLLERIFSGFCIGK